MKVEITNRWSGNVIFTAELDTDSGFALNLGIAVKKAITEKVNLAGAYLADANLARANLAGAYLADANLARANLAGANLAGANLAGAYLAGANLARANLAGANLADASMWGTVGNNRNIKFIQAGTYLVTYTATHMQIGCQRHSLEDWWSFNNRQIADMEGRTALEFWRTWKPLLQQIIAASPAEATGYVEPAKEESAA